MLLTAGREEGENRLADCDGLEGREGMGGGPQSPHNEGGHGPDRGGNLITDHKSVCQSPPAPSLYCSNHFAKPSSNLFI